MILPGRLWLTIPRYKGDYDPNIASCMVGCVTDESTLMGYASHMATTKGLFMYSCNGICTTYSPLNIGHSDYIQRFPQAVQKALFDLYPLSHTNSSDIKVLTGCQLLADHIFTGVSYQ